MDIINVIDWDDIAKKAVDNNIPRAIYDYKKKAIMDLKVTSGQYSTVHLNMYEIGIRNFRYDQNLYPKAKTDEFWRDIEDLFVIDIERRVFDDIRNNVLTEFAIEINDIDGNIWYGLSPDVIAKIYAFCVSLFEKNVDDRLYRKSKEDDLVLLSKPLSEIVDVDDGEWEDEDIEEFIVYRKE